MYHTLFCLLLFGDCSSPLRRNTGYKNTLNGGMHAEEYTGKGSPLVERRQEAGVRRLRPLRFFASLRLKKLTVKNAKCNFMPFTVY